MNQDLYRQELWMSIDQAAVNLYYMDYFRDQKQRIEPLYRGALGMVAVMAAVISFFDVDFLTKTVSVITAILAAAPLFFPVLPKSSEFDKMSRLRISVHEWLVNLENFWQDECTVEKQKKYHRMKLEYGKTENDLAVLFGKNSDKLIKKAHKAANSYLDKFFTS